MTVPRADFPADIRIGERFQAGDDATLPPFTVIEVTDTEVTLDANHPLCGVDLVFDVEVIAVRQATVEERDHGHAHSGDGHHH